ncbi:MAG: PSD1 and planctomycete cytochrome C domain-containing protein [Pirellulales bacterium]
MPRTVSLSRSSRWSVTRGAFSLLVWALAVAPSAAADPTQPPVDFVRDIRPLLAKHCFGCHGPDEEHREADLRLDTPDGILAMRDGRPAVVPRDLARSHLWQRIQSRSDDERMPPPSAGPRLTDEQQSLLRRWIEQGAEWKSHWAFERPTRSAPPRVERSSWVRNPIDQFILSKLEAAGLSPQPEADRRTLARRVAFDLTGLPPAADLLQRYLADERDDAYERYVEELLRSPRYGERWARMWLDLARFADTKGYEKDRTRTIWRYRDWVIDAFNADLPYDRFTLEQLAGDLLPDAQPEQILATAFHRNTMVNEEGGTDDEEFRVAAVKDRVDTTMQVWMGLTMGCSKCHSHKYDPISQREYYQFYAFFNQTEDSDKGDDRPTLAVPTPAQRDTQQKLADELAALRREYNDLKQQLDAPLAQWEAEFAGVQGWTPLKPITQKAASGASWKLQDDGSLLVVGVGPAQETYEVTLELPAQSLTGLRLEAIPDRSHPRGAVGRSRDDGNFVLSAIRAEIVDEAGGRTPVTFAAAEADYSQNGYPIEHAIKNDDPKKHGWAVSPRMQERRVAVFTVQGPIDVGPGRRLAVTLDHQFEFSYPGFSLGRFRLSSTGDARPSLKTHLPDEVWAVLRKPVGTRTADERNRLLDYFAQHAVQTQPLRERMQAKENGLAALRPVPTPVLRELPAAQQRPTRIHVRGNFLEQSDEVSPAPPAALAPWPADAPRNRLGVARWLVHPDNPLTARVAVNRHWAQFFGQGLVDTQEDFGSQGQPPSHPELLDWLACEFQTPTTTVGAAPWSLKALCRLIVTSSAYRQSSRVDADLLTRDPYNRLVSRGPRFRLEAEMIRDGALAAAGLLSDKMYGPSVMPRQPDGIWRSTYNTDKWATSAGEDKYRRSVYTFIKRTSPYPSLTTFDAPSREICTIRRISTNTPLQALVTLNDPVFVEAAQALARRAQREAPGDAAKSIERAFESALLRPASEDELRVLSDLYARRLADFAARPADAQRFAAEPLGPLPAGVPPAELAALTAVCNVLLNLDEFVTR